MNGLLIVDKPAGMTSHDVVALVRRATGERSVGHLGTLDPMATGVLPLLLGRWTRLAQFFADAEKTYTGTIRFGFATDTYDAEGTPVGEPLPLRHTLGDLQAMALTMQGETMQLPPVYSAKKIGGVPAHKLARAGADVPVKPARVTIYRFSVMELAGEVATFAMRVSSGGYVRSAAHELGQAAGVGAHLASLCRTEAGPFGLEQSIRIEHIKELAGDAAGLARVMLHPRLLLPAMPSVTAEERVAGQLRNGMQVNLPEFSGSPMVKIFTGPTELLAIGRRIAGTLMQPIVVLG